MSEVIPFIPLSLTCCHSNPSLCVTAEFLELSTVPALLYFPFTLLWSDLWSHHPQTVYVNTAVTLTLILLYSIFQSSFYLTSQQHLTLLSLLSFFNSTPLAPLTPFLLVMLLLIWNLCLIILCRLIFSEGWVLGFPLFSLILYFVPGWSIQAGGVLQFSLPW